MKLCGYCEYGYRLFMTETGSIVKLPIPCVFTEYHGRYWW